MDLQKLFNKYGFLIIMIVSCVGFLCYLAPKDIKAYNQKKQQEKIAQENQKNDKIYQNNTGEIQIIPPNGDGTQGQGVTDPNGKVDEQETKPHREFTKVDDSYLESALFIGNSRTQTISLYGDWKKTTFYVEQGVSIWKILDEKIVKIKGKKVTVKKALKQKKFDKIYIMLGINELGTGTAESFGEQYRKVIETIRELQPDSIIFIQSIMHVTSKKDKEKTVVNNKEINKRNKEIKKIANGYDIFWIDENEIFDAKGKGVLNPKYTSDGIHLIPSVLPMWKDFFLEHGIVK